MEHYLKKLENTVRSQWTQKALCDCGGESFTYADLAAQIELFRLFLSEAGVGKGEKISLCARNSARWAMTFWSINVNERVVVPLLADFLPKDIASLVNHSDSVLLFTDEEIWAQLDPEDMPLLKGAICIKGEKLLWARDGKVAEAWEKRKERFAHTWPDGLKREALSYPGDNGDDIALINYTSGTTGNPKGVMITYGALSDTDDFCNHNLPFHPGETIVSMLPLAHMYGLAIEFIHPNIDGVTVCFLGKAPSPTTLVQAMQTYRPSMVITVPLVMEKIYAGSIKPKLDEMKKLLAIPLVNKLVYRRIRRKIEAAFGGNVRCFIMGGAPLKPEAERCFSQIHLPYGVGYGMTEASPLLAWVWWTSYVPGSCGRAVHEVRIDSEDPAHIVGEIQARGCNLFVGYYKNPEAYAASFTSDGWFRTGDLGIIDDEGNIFIRGRLKSMILGANGQNIYPEELEAVLSSCPYVVESIAVDRGGKIVALVYADIPAGTDAETRYGIPELIRNTANKSLPAYSRIAKVELMKAPFKKTSKMSIKRYLYK